MNEIKYPSERTYWIAWTDETETDVQGYGWTDPTEVTTCPFSWHITTDEAEWLAKLAEYGIIPDIDEQGNVVL
jgi:hypothetical protein